MAAYMIYSTQYRFSGLKGLLFSAFFIFFFLNIFAQQQDASGWYLKKTENGISVYLRDLPDSRLKELKSVVKLKTSLSSIVALLSDFGAYPEWVYRCEKSSTLKKISDTEVIHYQTVTAPWPVDNRDFVVDVKWSQDERTGVVSQSASSLPRFIPLMAGHVRITEFKASWTLSPLPGGWVNVEYQLRVDPGGNVPAWLVNLAVVEGPYETTLHMKDLVSKKKYQDAVIPFIHEP
jgi:hypothetical protein